MNEYEAKTNDLILRIQIATPKSRERFAYAREAWAALDDAGRAAALASRADNIEALIEHNRGFIVLQQDNWRGICGRRIGYNDVEQAVLAGYIASIHGFDLERGWRHVTYAGWAIQTSVLKMFYALQDFANSESVTRLQLAVRRAQADHISQRGAPPTIEQIATATGAKPANVRMVLEIPELISGDGYELDHDENGSVPTLATHPAPENTESTVEAHSASALVTTLLVTVERQRGMVLAGRK